MIVKDERMDGKCSFHSADVNFIKFSDLSVIENISPDTGYAVTIYFGTTYEMWTLNNEEAAEDLFDALHLDYAEIEIKEDSDGTHYVTPVEEVNE